jgi:hypothetical protein
MPGHPLAKLGAPHWPPYRPSDAPPGPMATASLTGHLRAPYWPSGEASHWPPTGHKGAALGGRPSHRPSLAIREAPARLATYWPQWDGTGTPSPGP